MEADIEIEQNSGLDEMFYPVGLNILQNMPQINIMLKVIRRKYYGKSISFWCRGSSGAIIAAIMVSKLKKGTVNHIKKDGESSHSNKLNLTSNVNIIVDDFMSSGSTIRAILAKAIERKIHIDALLVTSQVYESVFDDIQKRLNLESKDKFVDFILCKTYRKK